MTAMIALYSFPNYVPHPADGAVHPRNTISITREEEAPEVVLCKDGVVGWWVSRQPNLACFNFEKRVAWLFPLAWQVINHYSPIILLNLVVGVVHLTVILAFCSLTLLCSQLTANKATDVTCKETKPVDDSKMSSYSL